MAVQQRSPTRVPTRWEPLQDIDRVTDRMRRMLDETFGDWPSALERVGAWSPSVDIEETDDAYVVEAELPGVKRDDVDIELSGNELSITGEVKETERKGVLRKQTRRVGRFEFRVRLPEQLDPDEVDADLKDGVLTIRVPKSEKAARKKIEIKK
jgi:HSP20 family protein